MKRKRFSVEQITAVLKQAEAGLSVVEVCRQVGITEQTSVALVRAAMNKAMWPLLFSLIGSAATFAQNQPDGCVLSTAKDGQAITVLGKVAKAS